MPFNIYKDFPKGVQKEFYRREQNYGVNLSNEIKDFRGGRTPWIRVASGIVYDDEQNTDGEPNAGNKKSNIMPANGIVLEPNIKNYASSNGTGTTNQFIAKEIKGDRKIEVLNPRYQPGPIVDNVTVESKGDMGLTRTAQFTWKAFTQNQFDVLSDFFCIAGATVVLEWGWHTFFNGQDNELLDLQDSKYIKNIASGKSLQLMAERSIRTSQAVIEAPPATPIYWSSPDAEQQQAQNSQINRADAAARAEISSATVQLHNRLRAQPGWVPDASITPYDALMQLGNNDYDLFIGTVTNYDISVDDGVYSVTVNMLTVGESFLNLSNNESGLKRFFSNSQTSGFRKFLEANKSKDPRIWVKDTKEEQEKSGISSSGGTTSVTPTRDYEFSLPERRRIKEIADVFLGQEPLFYGINSTIREINYALIPPGVTQNSRINSIIASSPNTIRDWTPEAFGRNIVQYMYVSDKHLIELFTRSAKLVVNWPSVLPESDGSFSNQASWREYRAFLLYCVSLMNALNGTVPSSFEDVQFILENRRMLEDQGTSTGYDPQQPKAVFDGDGYTKAGQLSPAHITELWDIPLLLNVIRYFLESVSTNKLDNLDASGTSYSENLENVFSSAQIQILSSIDRPPNTQFVYTEITNDINKIRKYIYLGLGVTSDDIKTGIYKYIATALNPFTKKSSALPIYESYEKTKSGDVGNDVWGEDDISIVLSALRVQKNSFNGLITQELDPNGWAPTFEFNAGGITDDESVIQAESNYAYITYGLLEELINKKVLGNEFIYNPILDSSSTLLWFHKNLVSSDKNTCILPNSSAPVYNIKNINEIVDNTTPRVDLTINGISHNNYYWSNGVAPIVPKSLTDNEGEMFLYSLFINTELIERVFSDTVDMYDAIIEILGYVNGALGRKYDFKIERRGNTVHVLDFTNANTSNFSGQYVFPYNTNRSFIKNLDISLSMPDQIAIQAILGETEEGKVHSILTGNAISSDLYRVVAEREVDDDLVEEDEITPVSIPSTFWEHGYSGLVTSENSTTGANTHTVGPLINFVYPHQPTIDINTEGNPENEMFPLPNSEVSITIDGISGIQFFNTFGVVFIPRRLRQVGRFFVKGLNHTITPDTWDTTLDSQYMIVPTKFWNKDETLDGLSESNLNSEPRAEIPTMEWAYGDSSSTIYPDN